MSASSPSTSSVSSVPGGREEAEKVEGTTTIGAGGSAVGEGSRGT